LSKVESLIKDTKIGLLLCNFCVKEKKRSRNFKTTFHLKWHISHNHLEEIPN